MTAIEGYKKQSSAIQKTSAEAQTEEERMRDVYLLVDSLFRREEMTTRLILDCLYDIGSINWVNNKFRSRPTNRLMKWIARLSKPMFRIVALRWMKKNCPRLITNWMHRKVTFEAPQLPAEATVAETVVEAAASESEIVPVPNEASINVQAPIDVQQPVNVQEPLVYTKEIEQCNQEIQRLRSQVKTLTVLLIGVTVSLGSAVAWTALKNQNQFQPISQQQNLLSKQVQTKTK